MRPRQKSTRGCSPPVLFGRLASGVASSAMASRFSARAARKNSATVFFANRSDRGARNETSGASDERASAGAGSCGAGSTTTPSGCRGVSGKSVVVGKEAPFERAAHPYASAATHRTLERLDGRIIRAGDGDQRMRRNHRPPTRLFVEVGGNETEATGSHIGDADAT